jgi:hypothetical protein
MRPDCVLNLMPGIEQYLTKYLLVTYQEFTSNLTMNFWPNLLVQRQELRPKIPGSVPGSGFGSWFDEKWTSWSGFGSCSRKIQDFLVPGRFLVNLVSFVPYRWLGQSICVNSVGTVGGES